MDKPSMSCFVCAEPIGTAPVKAVIFTSKGNYGSTVFDPITREGMELVIFICDGCVEARMSRISGVQTIHRQPERAYMSAEQLLKMGG
jgi:hypothetical protein